MRIGISTSVMQRGRSGVGQYVLALVQALQAIASAHEITLFALEDDVSLFESVADTMRVVRVEERHRPPMKNILWHQSRLPGLAAELALEVLHVPSYRRMLWPRPCPLVATIHDLAPFRLPGKYDWARMVYGRHVVRALAFRQDQIIAVSRMTADDIIGYWRVPPNRVTVVHNGLDHERFRPARPADKPGELARVHGVNHPFFVYVARLEHPAKNHVRLIAAFEAFKARTRSPWQLVLLGADWHGAEVIHEAARRSAYAADIFRLGFVSADDLPQWYRDAGAAVYPSLFEGFGLPPLEAMACGCPVLASNITAVSEVCDRSALLVDPADVDAMAIELARMASDGELRSRLGSAGLVQARRFDWARTAAATLDVYRRARRLEHVEVEANA